MLDIFIVKQTRGGRTAGSNGLCAKIDDLRTCAFELGLSFRARFRPARCSRS